MAESLNFSLLDSFYEKDPLGNMRNFFERKKAGNHTLRQKDNHQKEGYRVFSQITAQRAGTAC